MKASFDTPAVPDAVHIAERATFKPPSAESQFAWNCTGDVSISGPGGAIQLHDSDETTGLLVALRSGTK